MSQVYLTHTLYKIVPLSPLQEGFPHDTFLGGMCQKETVLVDVMSLSVARSIFEHVLADKQRKAAFSSQERSITMGERSSYSRHPERDSSSERSRSASPSNRDLTRSWFTASDHQASTSSGLSDTTQPESESQERQCNDRLDPLQKRFQDILAELENCPHVSKEIELRQLYSDLGHEQRQKLYNSLDHEQRQKLYSDIQNEQIREFYSDIQNERLRELYLDLNHEQRQELVQSISSDQLGKLYSGLDQEQRQELYLHLNTQQQQYLYRRS